MLNNTSMRRNRLAIATVMSCFLVCAAIAGCDDEDCCTGTMGPAPISLEGTHPCESLTCQTGEVCVAIRGGLDSGVVDPPTCELVPTTCTLTNCAAGECPACVDQICGSDQTVPTVTGRDVICGYP